MTKNGLAILRVLAREGAALRLEDIRQRLTRALPDLWTETQRLEMEGMVTAGLTRWAERTLAITDAGRVVLEMAKERR